MYDASDPEDHAGDAGGPATSGDVRATGLNRLPSRVIALAVVAVSIGAIGVFTGFAAFIGTAATAQSGIDEGFDYTAVLVTSGASFVLGLSLWASAYLFLRGSRVALPLLTALVLALVVSTSWRMAADTVSFVSVVSTVMSFAAITLVVVLLASKDVRDHVRR